jgi:hypothetical protein
MVMEHTIYGLFDSRESIIRKAVIGYISAVVCEWGDRETRLFMCLDVSPSIRCPVRCKIRCQGRRKDFDEAKWRSANRADIHVEVAIKDIDTFEVWENGAAIMTIPTTEIPHRDYT